MFLLGYFSPSQLNYIFLCSFVHISWQLRHMFAQCITAMAHHRYLELEGGHRLVEFIVRQCAISDEEVILPGL